MKVFPLTQYVCTRDSEGSLLEIVIRESITPLSLDADIREQVISDADYKEDEECELYTHIYKMDNGKFYTCQEVKGIKIPKSRTASMIDEYPILSIAATRAIGKTVMEGVEELRYKETDRIKTVCEGLQKIGVVTHETKDSLIIEGKGPKAKIIGNVEIDSNLDHRIAMSFLCLGLITDKAIIVRNTDTINSSFPFFMQKMNKIGANFNFFN
mgnify:CR=1 FL=1